jgi:hypothetical protein
MTDISDSKSLSLRFVGRRSDIRSIAVTPQRARVSARLPVAVNGQNRSIFSSKPSQVVMVSVKSSPFQPDYRFVFPFAPQNVSYKDIAPELSELERPGKKPLVAFSRLRAKKVDLEFLLAVPFDGLHIDIENEIKQLETMVASGRSVWFYNSDSFLALNKSDSQTRNPTFFWSIFDMSFQSVRRNRAQKITQASVVLSLVENTNPRVAVVSLPPISYTDDPPKNNPPKPEEKVLRRLSMTEVIAVTEISRDQRQGR